MDFTDYDTRVAGYAVIVDADDRVLTTWWNGEARPELANWSLPGGGIEFDEAIETASSARCTRRVATAWS